MTTQHAIVATARAAQARTTAIRPPKILELSKLPPAAPKSLRSIRFNPGSKLTAANIVYHEPQRQHMVDPSHPLAANPQKYAPCYRSPALDLRAFPKAVLSPSTVPYPFDASEGRRIPDPRSLNLAFIGVVSKKNVANSAFIRNRVKRKVKEALKLVVTRGADVDESGSIIFRTQDATERRWLLHDWAYAWTARLELYQMPLPQLIKSLRVALDNVRYRGEALESIWRASKSKQPESRKRMHR